MVGIETGLGGHCQDFAIFSIQQNQRAGMARQQFIGGTLQIQIQAQANIQTRRRLPIQEVVPGGYQGQITLPAAQVAIHTGLQTRLSIERAVITDNITQGRISHLALVTA